VLEGRINPGRVFDRTVTLCDVAEGDVPQRSTCAPIARMDPHNYWIQA